MSLRPVGIVGLLAIVLVAGVLLSAQHIAAKEAGRHPQQSHSPALLVLNKSDNALAIVDPGTLKVLATVPTGNAPHEVAATADGRFAFACNYGTGPAPGNTISIIDIGARKELTRLDLGPLMRPHGITEAGGKIYFTIEGSRAVARLDPSTRHVDWVMGTGQDGTHMVVVKPDQSKLYTANIAAGTVTMIRLAPVQGAESIASIEVGKGSEAIDMSPDGREVWIAHRSDSGMSIIDTATDKVKATFQTVKSPFRVKFTPDGRRVLVSDPMAGEIVIYDVSTHQEMKRIKIGGAPVGILVQPNGERAYIAETQANKVAVLDLSSMEIKATIDPGREPDGMAWAK
jgi:YVTN family beta-propeller protein